MDDGAEWLETIPYLPCAAGRGDSKTNPSATKQSYRPRTARPSADGEGGRPSNWH